MGYNVNDKKYANLNATKDDVDMDVGGDNLVTGDKDTNDSIIWFSTAAPSVEKKSSSIDIY